MTRNNDPFEQLKQFIFWSWTLVILVPGVLLVLLGIAAIVLPHFSPLTIGTLLAWIFTIGGISKIIYGILSRKAKGLLGNLLDGILDLLLGIFLFTDILRGILALTLLVGIFVFLSGVVTVIRVFKLRSASNRVWLLFSGMIRIILGLIIWSQWPSNPEWLIGLLVGIVFLASGLSLIKLGLTVKEITSKEA